MQENKIGILFNTCPWCGENVAIPTKLTRSCPDTIVRLGGQCWVCDKSPVALICSGKVEALDKDGAYTSEGAGGELIEGDLGPGHKLENGYWGYNRLEKLPVKRGDTVTIPKGTLIKTTSPKEMISAKKDYRVVVAAVDQGCDYPEHFCNPEIVWVGRGGYWYRADINDIYELTCSIAKEKPENIVVKQGCGETYQGIVNQYRRKLRRTEGRHDWSGAWMPNRSVYISNETFSVGIFKWVPARSGLKKTAVIFRIKGACRDAEKIYKAADDICDRLDNGDTLTGKSMTVR